MTAMRPPRPSRSGRRRKDGGGFRLLAATDGGLLDALEGLGITHQDGFSAQAAADVVCLTVNAPANAG
jgi:hypothetical protein